MNPEISVIIPTWNADKWIDKLLDSLTRQTLLPAEILIIDSDSSDETRKIALRYAGVRVLEETTFNHGGTRDRAFRASRGEYIVFLTQDAMPVSSDLLERLCQALISHPGDAAAYGRQIPGKDAKPRERLVRQFNYPAESEVHDSDSIRTKGLRAFFLSDACAIYRRDAYEVLGGFETDLRSNEDMLFAAKAIKAGYQIVYAADAQVIHSHNLSLVEQYRRNKLQGYELARHRELLENDSPVSSGTEMLKYVSKGLLKQGRVISWMAFGLDCVARFAGNRAGKREYEKELRKGKHGGH